MPYKDTNNIGSKARERFTKGLCRSIRCVNNRELGRLYCRKCLDDKKEYFKNRTLERRNAGLCVQCGYDATAGYNCLTCWTAKYKLRYNKNIKTIELIELIQKQNYECYYTKLKLFPGINASLDHKIPISRGGTNEISNFVWCDRLVNYAKHHMTDEEFMESQYILEKHYLITINNKEKEQLSILLINLMDIEKFNTNTTLKEVFEKLT